ncbi:S8 family peptidase [Kibdelosporangium aridum]|uniref:Subtilase family protein n=1 Tax=Kibdelosporangium aridum TaxID=2030 RepID=A0A1Y5Y6X5_KIBAR|nr:S8 family serine peptidase [Kibdelosporangium aridum]SMD26296.1 Subtilase family protein [Kibdelosporangium aridum]
MPLLRRVRAAAVLTAVLTATCTLPAAADPTDAGCALASSGSTSRYIVVFDRGTSTAEAQAEIAGACGATTVYYPQIAVAVATSSDPKFTEQIGADRAFSAQRAMPRKRKSEEAGTGVRRSTAVPSADRSAEQWDMAMINADAAHEVTTGDSDVVVGVLDSGIDATHPDLKAAVDPSVSAGCLTGRPDTTPTSWAPKNSPHGTHVAGTIAAADDGKGITGVAPGVRVASVRVVDDDGRIYPEYAVCGFMWAAEKRMTITNSSYFVDPWLFTCSKGGQRVVREALTRAVAYAYSQRVVNVAAATNENVDMANPPDPSCRVLPAGLRDVLAVSSVGMDKLKAGYSAYGLGVIDVTAPGGERLRGKGDPERGCVLSTVPGGYARSCGTSMAAPHVSGVLALLASTHPGASPSALTRMLNNQSQTVPCPADYDLNGTGTQDAYCAGYAPYNGFYGHGLVDALAAVTN